jgi:hypothetical protein
MRAHFRMLSLGHVTMAGLPARNLIDTAKELPLSTPTVNYQHTLKKVAK